MRSSDNVSRRSYVLWSTAAAVLGASIVFSAITGGRILYGLNHKAIEEKIVQEQGQRQKAALEELSYDKIALGNVLPPVFIPPEKGRAIRIDLGSLNMELYENGELTDQIEIVSRGKSGTPWETPVGVYKISAKEENHFSSIGEVWMPYSMQFYGNFFIHGWPYYPNGKAVAEGYSGGCIRLRTEDAKKVYQFADTDTAVYVYNSESEQAELPEKIADFYFIDESKTPPKLSAESFLVADLDSGQILLEKNAEAKHSIASLTKLVTALTSLETINQYHSTKVSKRALGTHGEFGNLQAGEIITTGNIIYPLLLESSNDAAEVLAEHMGVNRFISLMNEKVSSIGLKDTRFEDPSGLSAGNISSAKDLFKLTQYLFRHKSFILDVTKLALKKVNGDIPGAKNHTWYNNNYFVRKGDPKYLGGKNGYTDAAGKTLIAVFALPLSEFEKKNIAVIVLGSDNREKDAEAAVKFVTDNIYYGEGNSIKRLAIEKMSAPDQERIARLSASVGNLEEKKRNGSGKVSMIFTGDIMMDRGVEEKVEKKFAGDFSRLFAQAPFIKESDIAFANLEGPVSDKGKDRGGQFSFRMSPEAIPALINAGFDIVNLANNHTGDWGREAFIDTVERLSNNGLAYTGGGKDINDTSNARVIERNGTKIGFLGFSDAGPDWLSAGDDSSGILLAARSDFAAIIEKAKREADFLVVTFHFGEEYKQSSNERQKMLAKKAVDYGADMVIGHHPHVVQEIEYYKGALIAYSLGNFVFDQSFSEDTMSGLALEVVLDGGVITSVVKRPIKINELYQPSSD